MPRQTSDENTTNRQSEVVIKIGIDLFQAKVSSPYQFTIAGWAFSTQGKITSVEIYLAEQPLRILHYGLSRPDVPEHFQNPDIETNCGFRGVIELDRHTDIKDVFLTLKVVDQFGNTHSIPLKPIPDKTDHQSTATMMVDGEKRGIDGVR
ncbi:MAG: hypothetical protein AAF485_21525, partial [Chloroflexota bacterium]